MSARKLNLCLLTLITLLSLVGCLNPKEALFGEAKEQVVPDVTVNRRSARYNPLPSLIAFTYPEKTEMDSVGLYDFTVTDTCVATNLELDDLSRSGQIATLDLSNPGPCANNEGFTLTAFYENVKIDSDEEKFYGDDSFTYIYDNAPPTVAASVLAHSNITATDDLSLTSVPNSVVYAFSDDILMSSIDADDFTIDSVETDCATMPTIGTLVRDATNHRVTVPLTGIDCEDGESFNITLAEDAVSDRTYNGTTGLLAPHTGPASDLTLNMTYFESNGAVVQVGDGDTSADGLFILGDPIDIVIEFDKEVTVTGTPRLRLNVNGSATRYANYVAGSDSTELTFQYTVVSEDTIADLDYSSTTALGLNGGTITRTGSNGDISPSLTLAAPAAANSLGFIRDIEIDGDAPRISTSSPTGPTNTWGTSGRDISFTMDQEIDDSSLDTTDLTMTAGTCVTPPDVSGVSLGGAGNDVITFTIDAASCANGQTYTMTLDPAEVKDLSGNDGTGSSRSIAVTVDTSRPTLSLSAPSVTYIKSSDSVTYTVTFSGASSVTLADTDINFSGASTDCTAGITGSGTSTRTITIDGCSDNGAVQIDVAAGAATNNIGNLADAVAEGDITDFVADNAELPDPTENLPTVGAAEIYNIDTLNNFTLTFAGDVLGAEIAVNAALALSCDTGGGANSVSFTGTRTSDTVMTIAPSEASPDFVYNSLCEISGANVPDAAGNLKTMSAIPFTVAKNPTTVSGPSANISIATATGNGDLGSVVFNVSMDTSTIIAANVTLECDSQDITIDSLTPSAADTNILIDFDESDADWLGFDGDEDCTLTFDTNVKNSLGIELTSPVELNFSLDP